MPRGRCDLRGVIDENAAADDHIWKVCSWHENQTAMQVGSKSDQQGWDWLALHLDDGSALMLYQLRSTIAAPFRFAKWMAKNGETKTFSPHTIGMEPQAYSSIAGRQIPTRWRITLPEMGLDITVTPLNDAQYMPLSQPYWEGAVFIQGSHSGRGFLEMTGY